MKNKKEIIKYLFFGVATTFVNWFFYTLLVHFAAFQLTVGNIIAWVISVVFAFVSNKIWVFESRSWQPRLIFREGMTFLAARLVSGIVDMAGVPLLFHLGLDYPLFGIEAFAAKVSVSVFVVISNYFFSKFFIFGSKNK